MVHMAVAACSWSNTGDGRWSTPSHVADSFCVGTGMTNLLTTGGAGDGPPYQPGFLIHAPPTSCGGSGPCLMMKGIQMRTRLRSRVCTLVLI